ncbi:right-handed parallel beta-helix repeat-containing protein [bacterium]|nr:right-handed parallel beta-helix repeat-containing protein [bacterium]
MPVLSLDLKTPEAGSSTFYPFPHFTWEEHAAAFESVSEPVAYDIQIARDVEFKDLADEDQVYLNRYIHDRPLEPADYFWRVRGVPYAGKPGEWSKPDRFTICPCDETITVEYDAEAEDHFEAVSKALTRAAVISQSGRSVRVDFPKGTYRYDRVDPAFLELANVRNIVIDGNGSRVEALRYNSPLTRITEGENIAVMSFEVDLVGERPFTQGTVLAVDSAASTFTVRLTPGFPDYETSPFAEAKHWVAVLEPGTEGRLKTGNRSLFSMKDYQKVEDGVWNLTYASGRYMPLAEAFEVGDRFIQVARRPGGPSNRASDSRNVTFYDITTHASSGAQYACIEGSLVNVLHCRSLIKEGWFYSGNADGVHTRGLEIGPWVEGTDFQAIGDDSVALYARPATASVVCPDGRANALILNDGFMNLEGGNEVAFFNPQEGRILLECEVESVQKRDDGKWLATFSKPVPSNLRTGGSQNVKEIDQIWNRSKSCGDFMVRHNTFRNIRRFGAVFRARRGVVEDNTFDGCSNSAVIFVNEPFWPNGLYASDIIIRNNTIKDCAFELNSHLPITVFFRQWGNTAAPGIGPRGFLIEGNTFSDCASPQIEIVSARDVVIRDNVVREDGVGRRPEVEMKNTKNVVQAP